MMIQVLVISLLESYRFALSTALSTTKFSKHSFHRQENLSGFTSLGREREREREREKVFSLDTAYMVKSLNDCQRT